MDLKLADKTIEAYREIEETYLDGAATTRPYPEVAQAVAQTMLEEFGNPSSAHERGRRAKKLLDASRRTIAEALGVAPREIFFTSGGTESNNLAIFGAAKAAASKGGGKQIVTSDLEHASVTKTIRGLKREGWEASYVRAEGGDFDLDALTGMLNEQTSLITVMRVQNEFGYVFPLEEVCRLRDELAPQALVHTDAVQAFGKVPVKPRELGIDLLSVSGHKLKGPRGIGFLYVKRGTPLFTTAFGGGQERGLRSGTEALPLIVGLAKAVELGAPHYEELAAKTAGLKRQLTLGLQVLSPTLKVNSREDGSPYILSVTDPRMDNDAALKVLDAHGVRVSKASACSTKYASIPRHLWRPKHPLSMEAAGMETGLIESTLRFSFSYDSTSGDVQRAIAAMGEYYQSLS